MHLDGLAVLRDLRWLIVTVPADLPRHVAVALDRFGVTVVAGDAALEVVGVIEIAGSELDLRLGRFMTRRAAADGLLVAPVLLALHVAEKAGVEGDDKVLALHDLRVARDAAELLAAALFAQMRRVIELDRDDVALRRGDGPINFPFLHTFFVTTA